jgi:hypothetical protein
MALFDEVERLSDLPDGESFLLIDFRLRTTPTTYGEKEQIFLRIAKSDDSEPFWVSGFSAGILAQLRNSEARDFPVWVKLTTTEGTRGRSGTRRFVPSESAGQLSLTDDQLNGTDDDIPF